MWFTSARLRECDPFVQTDSKLWWQFSRVIPRDHQTVKEWLISNRNYNVWARHPLGIPQFFGFNTVTVWRYAHDDVHWYARKSHGILMISYLLCTDEFTITCSRQFRIYHLSNDLLGYTESSKVREQHILLNHALISMGVDMICNVGELDDHCVRKIFTQLLKMP